MEATASVTTASGVTSPASDVTWQSSNPAVAVISAAGVVTGKLQGTAIIRATSGGLSAQASLAVVPGDPATVTIFAGNNQSGPAGAVLMDPLCTTVKDAAGNLIIGAPVTYTVTTGGGTLGTPTTPVTGPDGVAVSGLWTLGPAEGQQKVTATSPGATPVTFAATAR